MVNDRKKFVFAFIIVLYTILTENGVSLLNEKTSDKPELEMKVKMKITWPVCIVPVKSLGEAKSRLSGALSASERADLSRMMMLRTVRVLMETSARHCNGDAAFPRVLVVSRDNEVLRMAKAEGAWGLLEIEPGLNQALSQAIRWVEARRTKSVLILPADLPLIGPDNVEAMLGIYAAAISENGNGGRTAVIAPCRHGIGTNALLLSPPNAVPLSYGTNSFIRHSELARERGVSLHVYRAPGVGLDIDIPADLEFYRATRGTKPLK